MSDPDLWFGFALLGSIDVLAICIALGSVKQDMSFGLDIILGCLATLAGGWAQKRFGSKP